MNIDAMLSKLNERMNDEFSQLVAAEEAKRSRLTSPQRKWEQLQQLLDWTETLPTGKRNTKDACLLEQARQLAELEAYRARTSPPTST